MMTYRVLLAGLLILTLAFFPVAGAQAQGTTAAQSQTNGDVTTSSPEETLAQTLRNAARDGVAVIVLDTEGRVLSQSAQTEPPADTSTAYAPTAEDYSRLLQVQEDADRVRDALVERLMQLPNAINEVLFILRAASPDGTILLFAKILGLSLLLFGIGVVVERQIFGKRIARRFVVSRVLEHPNGYAEKMPFLVFRFFMGVIGILVSMSVAYLIGLLFFPPLDDSAVQFTVTLINVAYFGCRVLANLWRMILSPFLSQYRIPFFSDRDARRLHRWMWMLGGFDICAILFGIWIGELGLNYDVYALVASALSAVLVLLNIMLVIVNGNAITKALRQGKQANQIGMPTRILSKIWAPAVVVYVIFAWVQLTRNLLLEEPGTMPLIAGAYGILISIIVVYGVVNYLIERGFARARVLRLLREKQADREAEEHARQEREARVRAYEGEPAPDPEAVTRTNDAATAQAESTDADDAQATHELTEEEIKQAEHDMLLATAQESGQPVRVLNSFEALARRVAGILAFVAGVYAFFYIWDNDSARMVESVFDRVLDIMIIIFIGYVVYHAFRIWIDTKIAEECEDEIEAEPGDEGGASSASRLATLLPLFRNFTLIVVVVTILLIVMMEAGINVGPLFAGAGIVGIAVGFGSQALVRDIFAGGFFLFDDAFRKGEYLDVGGVKGTVERISVRSFQLRHHLGALHTIPFGELQVMTNYSRDWVIMKLPLRVTYDTDVEKVRKLIKNLGIQLLEDPVIGQNFISPLKSQGVIEMQDSAMIIRVKFMTKPGDQWMVRKRVYEEIRVLFEREGINFAHREVTVRLAEGKIDDLTDEQKRKVAAAAYASLEEEIEDGAPESGDDR
ncbi:MAG: mechanosensitive ion channel domain-containing protein [Sulfitobacter sp.]